MKRDRWSSRTIFLFAAIGSAVGLGNIWRFPYLTYKFGGGAFLIPYLIALFVIGIPLLMLEFALGQKFQKGAVESFKSVNKKFGGIGLGAILSGFVVVIYYAAVMAWSLLFLIKSFQSSLPWTNDSKGYFFNSILGISKNVGILGGVNIPLLISLFIVWLGIFLIVRKGVKGVGKVVIITMPLPVILLVVLFIRGITLPGAITGITAYLMPDFSALLNGEIWLAAVSQIFFTLSIGFGIMIAYASFNKKSQNVVGDTYITAFVNSAISLFAGFVVFSILGYMSSVSNIGIKEVAISGPGLAFIVFPQAISLMPFAWVFAVLFFLVLLSLGIDSAFSIVEAVDTVIADNSNKPNKSKIAFFVTMVGFLLGIFFVTGAGLYLLDIVDHFITNYGLVGVGLFETIAIGWFFGAERLRTFINNTSKHKIGKWWNYMIKFVIPIILIVLIGTQLFKDITTPYGNYPKWALTIGWLSVIIPALIAIIFSLIGKRNKN